MTGRRRTVAALAATLALVGAACGGGDDGAATPPGSDAPTETPTETATETAARVPAETPTEATTTGATGTDGSVGTGASAGTDGSTGTDGSAGTAGTAGSTADGSGTLTEQAEQRIVPVNGDLAEVVYALGLGDQVVATDISATYPPEAADTPKIGYQRALTVEPILSFEPTIVLADDLAGPPEALDALERLGVDVARIPREHELPAISTKIHAVADALGVSARGDELAATFEAELARAETRAAAAVVESGRPRVLALYLRGEQVQLTFGQDSGVDALIEAAGGIDVGTEMGVENTAQLSLEAIVEAEPEVLLVTTTGLESVGGLDGLDDLPGLARTPAVRNGRVAVFEDQYLYGLGPRTGALVDELVDAFHP